VVGYYNRFDIFDLTVDRTRLIPARFRDQEQPVAEQPARNETRQDTGAGATI